MGDLGDLKPLGGLLIFHFVEDSEVLMGDGFGCFLLPSGAERGVCCSRVGGGGYGA